MISNIYEKLSGVLPVTREELFKLVSSHGRKDYFYTGDDIDINKCNPNECYPLENLDISKITNLSEIFKYSPYNGDISKWNLNKTKNMSFMFSYSDFNNDSLKDWDVSKVEIMVCMFYQSIFNKDISSWNVKNVVNFNGAFHNSKFDGDLSNWEFNKNIKCDFVFCCNQNFMKKYNNGNQISNYKKDLILWFTKNRKKIHIAHLNSLIIN